jgi:hypothetical protein
MNYLLSLWFTKVTCQFDKIFVYVSFFHVGNSLLVNAPIVKKMFNCIFEQNTLFIVQHSIELFHNFLYIGCNNLKWSILRQAYNLLFETFEKHTVEQLCDFVLSTVPYNSQAEGGT